MAKGFSEDLAEMTKETYENNFIDFLPRKGKVGGGAFCSDLPFIKQSRILTNFSGSLSDVVTIAHELGHHIPRFTHRKSSVFKPKYSMPVAETASTFNENIVMSHGS